MMKHALTLVVASCYFELMDCLLAGATGLVGTRLVSKLTSQGHSVRVLTRNPNAASGKLPYPRVEVFGPSRWNDAVKGSTVVINLAGALNPGLPSDVHHAILYHGK